MSQNAELLPRKTDNVELCLLQCWASVADGESALKQHRLNDRDFRFVYVGMGKQA